MPRATILTFGADRNVGRRWLCESFCIDDVLDTIVYPAHEHLNVRTGRCRGDGVDTECKKALLAYPRAFEIVKAMAYYVKANFEHANEHLAYFIQCQAGRSRSVALAQLVAEEVCATGTGWEVFTVHLDAPKNYILGTTVSGLDAVRSLSEDEYEELIEIPVAATIQFVRRGPE